ncbi:MAG: hypothetical protein AAGF83_19195 [Cyanobacteria bacterium P01_G01_bin.67]
MKFKNSPLKDSCFDLEIEAINRFRILTPFLDPKCHIFRELYGLSTVLCLDFSACPQDLKLNLAEWQEFSQLLAHSSHYLGLADSLTIKVGDHILSWVTLT